MTGPPCDKAKKIHFFLELKNVSLFNDIVSFQKSRNEQSINYVSKVTGRAIVQDLQEYYMYIIVFPETFVSKFNIFQDNLK